MSKVPKRGVVEIATSDWLEAEKSGMVYNLFVVSFQKAPRAAQTQHGNSSVAVKGSLLLSFHSQAFSCSTSSSPRFHQELWLLFFFLFCAVR